MQVQSVCTERLPHACGAGAGGATKEDGNPLKNFVCDIYNDVCVIAMPYDANNAGLQTLSRGWNCCRCSGLDPKWCRIELKTVPNERSRRVESENGCKNCFCVLSYALLFRWFETFQTFDDHHYYFTVSALSFKQL
jgi:hypothetical protein